jgi:hypothetical protein
MKNILAALVLFFFAQSLAIGQFGISGAYKTFTADGRLPGMRWLQIIGSV